MTFYSDPKLRTIDFDITLTAAEDVTFGDTKEGAFAIRLAEPFTEKKGGEDGRRRWPRHHGEHLGQTFELGGLHGESSTASSLGSRSSTIRRAAQSDLLACARLRPVRTESVWPDGVRSETGGEPVETAQRQEVACSAGAL